MNVDETQLRRAASPWLGLEKYSGAGATEFARFEDVDLAFFHFLTQGIAGGVASPQEGDAPGTSLNLLEFPVAEEGEANKTQIKSGEQLLKTTIQVVQAADEVSRKKVGETLELLESELTTEDIGFLSQAVVNGLAYPGGVPFQQFVPLGVGGKPSFARLKTSDAFAQNLSQAYKTGKALRVALDDRSAVILRFAGGKVSAEFLTQDAAMAGHLKASMDELRQRLADKNLPVADLLYRDPRQPQHQQQQESPPRDEESREQT